MATPTNEFPDTEEKPRSRPAPWKGSLVAGVGCCSVSVLLLALDHCVDSDLNLIQFFAFSETKLINA